MIAAVDLACSAWGRATRYALEPIETTLDVARRMLALAESGQIQPLIESVAQSAERIDLHAASSVWRAVAHPEPMPDHLYVVLWLHYVQRARVKQSVQIAQLSVPKFWRTLHSAHWFLAGRGVVPRESLLQRKNA